MSFGSSVCVGVGGFLGSWVWAFGFSLGADCHVGTLHGCFLEPFNFHEKTPLITWLRDRVLVVNICLVIQVSSYRSRLSNNLPTLVPDLILTFCQARSCGTSFQGFTGVNKPLLFEQMLSPLFRTVAPALSLLEFCGNLSSADGLSSSLH